MSLLFFLVLALIPFTARAEPCESFNNTMEALEVAMADAQKEGGEALTAHFTKEFADFDDLNEWAEGSTWGGGHAEQIDFQGHKIAITTRSYTSGIKSGDIGIYQLKDNKWLLIKTHPPVTQTWIVRKVFDDKIIFHTENSNEALLVLTIQDLL
jgi:hypothetical protein